MKAGSLVRYNSRLLLVLRPHSDEYGNYDGWVEAVEVGTNRHRIYDARVLTLIKSEKEFYL